MDTPITTPFTAEQVAALNRFQESGQFHPYTCGYDSRHRELVATVAGWKCPDCDYTQEWAHQFSTLDLPNPLALKG